MKTKTLIFACLICFIALLTSCDNTMPQGGKYDEGQDGGNDGTSNPRSLNDTINNENKDPDLVYQVE